MNIIDFAARAPLPLSRPTTYYAELSPGRALRAAIVEVSRLIRFFVARANVQSELDVDEPHSRRKEAASRRKPVPMLGGRDPREIPLPHSRAPTYRGDRSSALFSIISSVDDVQRMPEQHWVSKTKGRVSGTEAGAGAEPISELITREGPALGACGLHRLDTYFLDAYKR